jgi:hypothetical protein
MLDDAELRRAALSATEHAIIALQKLEPIYALTLLASMLPPIVQRFPLHERNSFIGALAALCEPHEPPNA